MRVVLLAVVMTAATLSAMPPLTAEAKIPPSESGRAAMARFRALDTDHDGGLSRRELAAVGRERAADALFLLLDGDGDGRLSAREVEGAGGSAALARFDAYDVDKNGFVIRREFPSFPDPRLLAALDRDGDGRIAMSELRPAFAGMGARPRPPERLARTPGPAQAAPKPCWVPTPKDGEFQLEMPVIRGRCG